uniref:Uncharacterized protein n=1 Tax=Chromera velia CCMP2878 TaxID=1169474 RepID=A0A0G4H6W7_9ALVE|eukprot:Cvel_5766.t1-p1 / transcript=Cvel_5766.t1 / gene=Cvel_5766 / organism=Chromera_velia_CCMP2878 / gene_product=hypothetical protein / transcript_product=hypothetical protein / location=Cvel_scaffold274:16461-17877(+) / protein_length=321 / sequence_SO=supercontig / SO=protein_coding / is_pseudo=false
MRSARTETVLRLPIRFTRLANLEFLSLCNATCGRVGVSSLRDALIQAAEGGGPITGESQTATPPRQFKKLLLIDHQAWSGRIRSSCFRPLRELQEVYPSLVVTIEGTPLAQTLSQRSLPAWESKGGLGNAEAEPAPVPGGARDPVLRDMGGYLEDSDGDSDADGPRSPTGIHQWSPELGPGLGDSSHARSKRHKNAGGPPPPAGFGFDPAAVAGGGIAGDGGDDSLGPARRRESPSGGPSDDLPALNLGDRLSGKKEKKRRSAGRPGFAVGESDEEEEKQKEGEEEEEEYNGSEGTPISQAGSDDGASLVDADWSPAASVT